MRTLVTLACTECKRRNYTTDKNKSNNPDRMQLKKYCPWCKKHTLHRETRYLGGFSSQASSSNGRAAVSKTVC